RRSGGRCRRTRGHEAQVVPLSTGRRQGNPRSGGLADASGRSPGFGPSMLKEQSIMIYTIAVVLIILWLLGLVTSYTMGGFIHILLVIALIMIVVNLLSGRRGAGRLVRSPAQ